MSALLKSRIEDLSRELRSIDHRDAGVEAVRAVRQAISRLRASIELHRDRTVKNTICIPLPPSYTLLPVMEFEK